MKKMRLIFGAISAMLVLPATAQGDVKTDVKVYGKIHMSADVVKSGVFSNGVSSNASRIGFKGKEDLNYGLKAIWKIESELNLAEDTQQFESRNRYLGLNRGKSTLIGGYHDTPFKTLGSKVEVFINTVADRRGILGRNYQGGAAVGSVTGGSMTEGEKFDVRATNSVMYINNTVKGLDFRLMRSAGSPAAIAGDKTPITSTSILYKSSHFMIGGAYEAKEADRTSGMRFLGGIALGPTRVTGIYEKLSFGGDGVSGWNRSVMGFSAIHKVGTTSLKTQAFFANDLNGEVNSGGRMYAGGLYHALSKTFKVYGVVARMENDVNASYTLAGSGHGDSYYPAAAGGNMHSISAGSIYKF